MESPFAPGERVRVRASVDRYGQRFTEGEVLRFEMAWYSRYDDADVYTFKRADGSEVNWFNYLRMSNAPADDPDSWRQYLERV